MSKIVVGVDGSPGSRAALRWAHEEAALRNATLEIVTVWQFPMMTSLPAFGAMPPPDDLSGDAERMLLQVLSEEGVASSHDVPVTTVVAEGGRPLPPCSTPPRTPTCWWSAAGVTAGSPASCSDR